MSECSSVLIVAAMQRGLVVGARCAVSAIARAAAVDRRPVLALRSDGLVTPLVSVRRRLFSMRASRAFTSSNSDEVTMYSSRAGRMCAISSWRMQNAVGSLRMVGKDLGHRAGLALFQRLNLLKECNKRLRIVARAVHVLHAQVVGLRLEFARECA